MLVKLYSYSLPNKESKFFMNFCFSFCPATTQRSSLGHDSRKKPKPGPMPPEFTSMTPFLTMGPFALNGGDSREKQIVPSFDLVKLLFFFFFFSGQFTWHFRSLTNWIWQTLVEFPDLAIVKVSSHMCWSDSLWNFSLTPCELGLVLF